MLKQLKQNNSGVVFFTVLVIIFVMMILSVSIISMNISQVTLSEGEVKRIQAESLASGALAYTYTSKVWDSSPADVIIPTETLDGQDYDLTSVLDPTTGDLSIQVNY